VVCSAVRLFARLGVEEIAVDHASVLDLALKTGLTAPDANYLHLAQLLEAELVTLDKQLGRTAGH
jgi:predicted nucleic acid-binding protein